MILVTGGLGVIGTNFLNLLREQGRSFVCVDSMTYASYVAWGTMKEPCYIVDLTHFHNLENVFKQHEITEVYHLAAETHVDRSITNIDPFIQSNIIGTLNLLKLSHKYGIKRFIHVSTDEVYGDITYGSASESTPYYPRNPYSATKAASDHLVTAWFHTYNLPTIITHCTNNYGPFQHNEKLLPTIIGKLKQNKSVPVYGDGKQIRDWLYVKDHCRALLIAGEQGFPGETYNIGSDHVKEVTNIELVQKICDMMNKSYSLIEHIQDRPGHDRRYSISSYKIRIDLGWYPITNLDDGLNLTIEHFLARSA